MGFQTSLCHYGGKQLLCGESGVSLTVDEGWK